MNLRRSGEARAGTKLALQSSMTTVTPSAPLERAVILTAVDGSSISLLAAGAAARFAALPGSEIHLVHVIEGFDAKNPNAALEKARAMLEHVAEESRLATVATLHSRCPVYVARAKNHGPAASEIEPPCPDCVTVQGETDRKKLWCERHSTRHVHGHLHFEMPQGFAAGSTFFQS